MDLSPYHRQQIQSGNAILFLGAGANYGAQGPSGEFPLFGDALRNRISDELLDGELKDRPLAEVAQYARELSSVADLQQIVSDIFEPIQPAAHHLLIAKFRWFAIVTTNYDFVIERAYQQCSDALQRPTVITRNEDRLTHALQDQQSVPLIKLHGTLATITDPSLPLILATDEYVFAKQGRDRLFRAVGDWATEYPIFFVGYRIADPHIRDHLFDPTDMRLWRPQHAIVDPELTTPEIRYWSGKHFSPHALGLKEFLQYIDQDIPSTARQLSALLSKDQSSLRSYVKHGAPSDELILYLESHVTHVRPGMPFDAFGSQQFFRGYSNSWAPIFNEWDIERGEIDTLTIEAILELPETPKPRLFLLTGHAGSGKSVALRRIAWDAAVEHGRLVLWLEGTSEIDATRLEELHNLSGENVVLVIDNAIPHIDAIRHVYEEAARRSIPLTIISGARTNEWYVEGGGLVQYVEDQQELYRLKSKEIADLLTKLEQMACLGELEHYTAEQRHEFFVLTAERQLLVALHEATSDARFADIVHNEYKNIVPKEAQILYLDVCTLNRFGVGVRAGLLSRVSGITFREFRERLFEPLRHVVETYFDGRSQDYAYRARHSVIADMVFHEALTEPAERCDQIVRIIGSMNVSFDTDRLAFEQLIRGRNIADLFADRSLGERIFRAAESAAADQSHVQHQMAVFELNHSTGDLEKASQCIDKALELATGGKVAIRHTEALILREKARAATSRIEREKLREEAKDILKPQMRRGTSPYPYHAFGRTVLDELKEALNSDRSAGNDMESRIVADAISQIERVIREGLLRFTDDSHLKSLEAELAQAIDDAPRARSALEQALAANPGSAYVAVRVARIYRKEGDITKAQTVLRKAIEQNPNSKVVHFETAIGLMQIGTREHYDSIQRHLRASFTEGDSNYQAQFTYARFEYIHGDRQMARRTFDQLAKARMEPRSRDRVRELICNQDGEVKRYTGTVVKKGDSFAFLRIAELGDDVYVRRDVLDSGEWDALRYGSEAELSVGFSYRGPAGTMVRVVGSN